MRRPLFRQIVDAGLVKPVKDLLGVGVARALGVVFAAPDNRGARDENDVGLQNPKVPASNLHYPPSILHARGTEDDRQSAWGSFMAD